MKNAIHRYAVTIRKSACTKPDPISLSKTKYKLDKLNHYLGDRHGGKFDWIYSTVKKKNGKINMHTHGVLSTITQIDMKPPTEKGYYIDIQKLETNLDLKKWQKYCKNQIEDIDEYINTLHSNYETPEEHIENMLPPLKNLFLKT
jgi:hypothetical protein